MSYSTVESLLKACAEPENYNFEFECDVEDYIKLPSIERYLTYRATASKMKKSAYDAGKEFAIEIQKSGKYRQLADCDGSEERGNISLIHDVYSKLWGWKKGDRTFGSIVGRFKCQFGADTMNSMQTILNDIAKEIIEQKEHKKLLDKKTGFFSINYLVGLYKDAECSEELISALDSVEGLTEYADAYHTIGNFALVPGGFNAGRYSTTQDYWDRSLQHLKNCGWKEDFNCNGKNINDYYRYTNYFFLWDYVDAEGNYIPLLKSKTNDLEGKKQFLKKVIQLIKRRGCFMVAMLKLQQVIGMEAYKEIRNSVFSKNDVIYRGYEDVFEAVKECLKDNMTGNIDNLLLKAKEQISGI